MPAVAGAQLQVVVTLNVPLFYFPLPSIFKFYNRRGKKYTSPPPPQGASFSSHSVPSHAGAWPLATACLNRCSQLRPSTRCRHLMQGTASFGHPGRGERRPACCRHLLHPRCLSPCMRSHLPADPSARMLISWWSRARPHSAPWERLQPTWTAPTSQTAALLSR